MKVILSPLYPWSGPQSVTENGIKKLLTLPTVCSSGEGPIELGQGRYTFGRSFLNPPCMDASSFHFSIHIPKEDDEDISRSTKSIQIERVSEKSVVVVEINGSTSNLVKLTSKGQMHTLNVGDVIRWPNYRLRVELVQNNGSSLEIPTPRGVTFTPIAGSDVVEGRSVTLLPSPKRPRVDNSNFSIDDRLLSTHRPVRHHLLLLPLLSVGRDYSASIEVTTTQLLSVLNEPATTTCKSGRAAASLSLSLFTELLHVIVVVSREQFESDRRLQDTFSDTSTAIICGDLIHPYSDESTRQAVAKCCNGLDSRKIIKEGGISALVCRSNRRYICDRSFDELTSELFREAKGEIPRPSYTTTKNSRDLSSSSSSSSSSNTHIAPISTSRVVSCSTQAEISTSYINTQGISHIIYSVCPSFIPNRPNTPTASELSRANLLTLLRDSYRSLIQDTFEEIATLADRSRMLTKEADDVSNNASAVNAGRGQSSTSLSRPTKIDSNAQSVGSGMSSSSTYKDISTQPPSLIPSTTVPSSSITAPPPSIAAPLPIAAALPLVAAPSSFSSSISSTAQRTYALWETPDDNCFYSNSRSALFEYAKNPANFQKIIRYEDENCVIVSDRFPKARLHFLLLAKPSYLNNVLRLTDLKQRDVAKLEVLYQTARSFATNTAYDFFNFCKRSGDSGGYGKGGGGPLTMNIGLHMIPSLEPLHIHIISDDFCSVWVKTKRHFNSFASDFFYKLDELIQSLREIGDLAAEINPKMAQRQLDKELKCTKCGLFGGGTMAEFKIHLESHIR